MVELAATIFVCSFFISIAPSALLILFSVIYGIVMLPVVIVKAMIETVIEMIEEERKAKEVAKSKRETESKLIEKTKKHVNIPKTSSSIMFTLGSCIRRTIIFFFRESPAHEKQTRNNRCPSA